MAHRLQAARNQGLTLKAHKPLAFVVIFLLGTMFWSGSGKADEFKITYNADWPPYSSGSMEKVRGILPDLLNEIIGNRMGYTLRHGGFPWKRAQAQIESGAWDGIVTFPSNTRLTYTNSSKNSVYTLKQRPVVLKDSIAEQTLAKNPNIEQLKSMRVCMMIGDGWSKSFYESNKIAFIPATDIQACLRMVARGRTDVFLHPEAAVNMNARKANLSDELTHLPDIFGTMGFTLLLSKKSRYANTDFIERFDDVLETMISDGSLESLIANLDSRTY